MEKEKKNEKVAFIYISYKLDVVVAIMKHNNHSW